MLLKSIIDENVDAKFENAEIENIARNSQMVSQGDVYFCLSNDFDKALNCSKEALDKGAKVVISNFDLPFENAIKVEDCRDCFAKACASFYGRACDELKIVGVTGTNGKTTTVYIISEMLKRNGKNVGVIGTSGVFYNGKVLDCPLTTPDADFLHKTFFEMKNAGVEYVVMEVSAHAIEQKRINGINFEVGILTNVTQDHLDYFKTFENYEKTKLSFFDSKYMKKGIICVDDESARKLLNSCDIPIVTYGVENPCDVFAIDSFCTMNGSSFVGNVCDQVMEIKTNLIGQYNIYNSLAALATCYQLGLNSKQLCDGLNFMYPVEGRFNVSYMDGKYVVIDYAHSPDSLMNVLKTAKQLTDKEVHVVFGCGGNRDKDKRHKMGAIAEKYADHVCLTDDNPRLEDSLDIIHDIEEGMTKEHIVETDRALAIRKTIDSAKAGDIVIIAGKGAERYQEIGTEKKPYNDFDTLYEYFKETDPTRSKGREFL